ncbi:MAG: hypothetical protein P4L51_24910 [Puia sp.]|nr:hypothetical protein [Puia sp.]
MLAGYIFVLALLDTSLGYNPFPEDRWESGVIDLNDGGDDIFYIYFEARKPRTNPPPLVMWLSGGPGWSSFVGFMAKMGPYKFNRTTLEYYRNPHAWNEFADLLFVDQPVGTGFSRARDPHECTGLPCVYHNFYNFFKKLMVKHPEFRRRPFYLTGDSYVGKYNSAIARYLLRINDPDINIKGLMIGGPMVNRYVQRSLDPLYFYRLGLFTLPEYILARTSRLLCAVANATGFASVAIPICANMNSYYLPLSVINDCDIADNETYDKLFDRIEKFLDSAQVKAALGVPDRKFVLASPVVEENFHADFLVPQDAALSEVVRAGVNVTLYVGVNDPDVHWRGVEQVALNLAWEGQSEFAAAEYQAWKIYGKQYADRKSFSNLKLVRVLGAGHLVPLNQPYFSYKMLEDFVYPDATDEYN